MLALAQNTDSAHIHAISSLDSSEITRTSLVVPGTEPGSRPVLDRSAGIRAESTSLLTIWPEDGGWPWCFYSQHDPVFGLELVFRSTCQKDSNTVSMVMTSQQLTNTGLTSGAAPVLTKLSLRAKKTPKTLSKHQSGFTRVPDAVSGENFIAKSLLISENLEDCTVF